MHHAPSMCSSGLQAGAAVEDNHYVFAEVLGLLFLTFAQPLPGGNHQHNRDNAPGNSEHSKKRAQLVRPECA